MEGAEAPGDGWLFTPGTEPRGSGLVLDCDRGGHSLRSKEEQRGCKGKRIRLRGTQVGRRGSVRGVDSETSHREGSDPEAGLGKSWLRTERGRLDSRGGGKGLLPGSSGTGRSGGSGGPSLSVFSSVDPAYGSSPFSPWPVDSLCSLCSATLREPRGGGTA